MNRWQALVSIVRAFLARGRPGLAFASILVIMSALLGLALIPVLVLHLAK